MMNETNISLLLHESNCDASQRDSIENIAYTISMVLILLASIIGNGLVILATASSPSLRNRVTILLIVSLACSDLLNAISQIPFHISAKFHQRFCYNLATCYFQQLSDVICNAASISSLFAIALERFIAIKFPFHHQIYFTRRRTTATIVIIWVFSLFWASIGVTGWDTEGALSIDIINHTCRNANFYYYAVGFVAIYLIPLATMTFTYLIILQIAIKQIKSIEAGKVEFSPVCDFKNDDRQERSKRRRIKKRILKKELKATKSVALVYFAFLLCWFPNLIINLILMFDKYYFAKLKKANETLFSFILYTFIQILPMINTMSNPVIYSFSNQHFRSGFKDVFKKILRNLDRDDFSGRRETQSTLDGLSMKGTPRCSVASMPRNSVASAPRSSVTSVSRSYGSAGKRSYLQVAVSPPIEE